MRKEVVAKGTPQEWICYYPEGSAMFVLDKEKAEQLEQLGKERNELIQTFYQNPKLLELNRKIEKLVEENDQDIKIACIEYNRIVAKNRNGGKNG